MLSRSSIPARRLVGTNFHTDRPMRFATATATTTTRRSLGSGGGGNCGTYYDSQSGLHVPIHDESMITAYFRHKSYPAVVDVHAAKSMGMAGSIIALPRQALHRDDDDGLARVFESLTIPPSLEDDASNSSKAPTSNDKEFTIFVRLPPSPHPFSLALLEKNEQLRILPVNVNLCFEYTGGIGSDAAGGETAMAEGIRTVVANHGGGGASIGIFNPTHYNDADPISVASEVAHLIDVTGGGSRILLAPAAAVDGDEMVRLCEELSYLDVAGPTIKSRLVVSVPDVDQLEECLSLGITKFIVDDDAASQSLDALRDAVEEQGKELILNR